MVVGAEAEKPFPYPLFSYLDHTGITWLTNSEGKSLYRWKDGKDLDDLKYLLRPIEKVTIRAMFVQDNEVWLGNDAETGVHGLMIKTWSSQTCLMAVTP